jgi:hypothetical protein
VVVSDLCWIRIRGRQPPWDQPDERARQRAGQAEPAGAARQPMGTATSSRAARAWRGTCGGREEDLFGDLDQREVDQDERGEDQEERGRRWGEAQQRAEGENGSAAPTRRTASVATSSAALGRLRRNGTRRVRIAKMTSDWVASDSTNQPVRNSSAPAWKSPNMIAKVRKSNSELIGRTRA